jgi:signal transduction histidine kinase
MSELFSQFSMARQEASLGRGDVRSGQFADVDSAALYDLAHELRQPLGVIESLAYYLELISLDDAASVHLRRIQAMVAQANGILERTCESPKNLALAAVSS